VLCCVVLCLVEYVVLLCVFLKDDDICLPLCVVRFVLVVVCVAECCLVVPVASTLFSFVSQCFCVFLLCVLLYLCVEGF